MAPLTLEALSRHAVESDVLALLPDGRIGHIVVADTADAIVVAPATAHWLGAMATRPRRRRHHGRLPRHIRPRRGRAGDGRRDVRAPGDARQRRADCATTSAIGSWSRRSGRSPAGQTGVGRLAALRGDRRRRRRGRRRPADSCAVAGRAPAAPRGPVREADLEGRHVVVTAGGTAEPIDPVRFIGNRSTGKMGVAIAAGRAGSRGPRHADRRPDERRAAGRGATSCAAESTAAMRAALLERARRRRTVRAGLDALVMAAAVADFRPVRPAATKLSRGEALTLELEPTPDILAEVGRIARGLDTTGAPTREPLPPRPILVGFAAETGSLGRAAGKLHAKGLDLLVANDVAEAGVGFGTDTNRVTIYRPSRTRTRGRCSPSARSRTGCSISWRPRWTPATSARAGRAGQCARERRPTLEPASQAAAQVHDERHARPPSAA